MVEFQIYDFIEDHEAINNKKEYIIHVFGRSLEGKSIYVKMIGYKPYFYILFPDELQNKKISFLEMLKTDVITFINSNIKNKNYSSPDISIIKSKKADYFCDEKKFYFLKIEFVSYFHLTKYKNFIENALIKLNNKSYKFKVYEADLSPMLRCFHINNISGCSWVKIEDYTIINNNTLCDFEYQIYWTNIKKIDTLGNAPLRICSFDIECYSENGEFPKANNEQNKIIQIGYSYTIIGESKPYRKYIGVLKDTDKFDDETELKCFDTEEELLLDFNREINSKEGDCDIITGYNIYFFDEKYIYDRCELLKIDINYLSKLKNHKCKFNKNLKLSSAALGENTISIWNTPGRVHIDLMKDIQRTYVNLSSYKLDNVLANFIKAPIVDFEKNNETIILKCNNTNDININDYIHIEIDKGVLSDRIGNKYLVININKLNNEMTIVDKNNEFNITDIKCKLFWTQAKDDITPTDIFNSYKGTPKDRSIIAKYCIKDCILVNILINKLETVIKNIEMANVCCVPLSYLFTRGQGIKIFSLCLKEFRNHNYLFPIIHVNNSNCEKCKKKFVNLYNCLHCSCNTVQQDIERVDDNYEGAIVIEPIPSIEYEPIAVKDYSSLYPSSIIQKNISHETIVEHEEYNNLENVKYYTAVYKDKSGKNKKCIFAKKNKLGVLPSILNNLLKERKNIRNKMKVEKDQFKYSVLNAKQLAIKVTANSLYGQLGSIFSHIQKKELAASTTSTGRDMLMYAKKYDEEILPCVLNSLKYYYTLNYCNIIEHIYTSQLITDNELKQTIKLFLEDTKELTIQPIVRYGDTDSVFSCYRFKVNSCLISKEDSLIIWRKVITFSYELIKPYFEDNIRIEIHNVYKKFLFNITTLEIPIINNADNNKYIEFVKEYIEEKFIPLLWTITEIIEKDQMKSFDIKFLDWLNYFFNKYDFIIINLFNNRKDKLCNRLETLLLNKFNPMYTASTVEDIMEISLFINKNINNDYPISILNAVCNNLLIKNIKEKWEYSIYNKKLISIIEDYLKIIIINYTKNTDLINSIIKKIILNKEITLDILKTLKESYIKYILVNNDIFLEQSKLFIIIFNKHNGRKSMLDIVETFIKTGLKFDFNSEISTHYDYIKHFIIDTLGIEDMRYIDKKTYTFYWLHSRWEYNDNYEKKIIIDIYKNGDNIKNEITKVDYTIQLGKLSGNMIKYLLDEPHDCEYEKTYFPFIILKKKKYVGNKYEFNPNKYYQDFTGIVLKRRDNAPIVKEICGCIIDQLMNKCDNTHIVNYLKQCIEDMFNKKYNITYFLQTRSLKSKESYKDWTKIAHMVLANKIMERDPGNVIQSGTRLEYAIIKMPKTKKTLQGDIIEEKVYIEKNNLEIDYLFYLKFQIMNPALQFLELIDDTFNEIFEEYIDKYSKTDEERLKNNIKNIIKDHKFKNIVIKYKKLSKDTKYIITDYNNKIKNYLTNY